MSSAERAARTARERTLRYDVYLTGTGISRSLCAKALRDGMPSCDLHDAVVLVQKPTPVLLLTNVPRRVGRTHKDRLLKVKATVRLQVKTNEVPPKAKDNGFHATVRDEMLPAHLTPVNLAPHTLECDVSTRLCNSHHGCGCICHKQEASE